MYILVLKLILLRCRRIINPFRPMKFSIQLHTIKFNLIHSINGGSQIIFSQKYCIFLWILILSLQTVKTLMKCHLVWYFIWVFTVSHITVSSPLMSSKIDFSPQTPRGSRKWYSSTDADSESFVRGGGGGGGSQKLDFFIILIFCFSKRRRVPY